VKVAIVHDWLVTYAGAERVLEQLLQIYPEADLFSLIDFVPRNQRDFLGGRPVRTSFMQRLPGARSRYRYYLPLMPLAVEQFDLSKYELVVSSSYAVAKGVLTGPDQLHICVCYSPMRYAWDLQHEYLREAGLARGVRSAAARYILHRMRTWDVRTANGVDGFVAISDFIARRIWKTYRREAVVIYPPVDIDTFVPDGPKQDYYVTASRLVPYKRIDLLIDAFSATPERRLIVIGDGPEAQKLRNRAAANVELLGRQPLSVLLRHLQQARAFVFAAEEDFGIAPLEAQACGTPVIAFGKGGVLETLRGQDDPEPTAVFYQEQSVRGLKSALHRFESDQHRISPSACRENALRFSPQQFQSQFREYVRGEMGCFAQGRSDGKLALPALVRSLHHR
jgi:glycosyltransferase involved in cell wall biosynthesis